MENKSSVPSVSVNENKGTLNMHVYKNGNIDVNELIRHNRELSEEVRTLSANLEWAMGQLRLKDALLKRLS